MPFQPQFDPNAEASSYLGGVRVGVAQRQAEEEARQQRENAILRMLSFLDEKAHRGTQDQLDADRLKLSREHFTADQANEADRLKLAHDRFAYDQGQDTRDIAGSADAVRMAMGDGGYSDPSTMGDAAGPPAPSGQGLGGGAGGGADVYGPPAPGDVGGPGTGAAPGVGGLADVIGRLGSPQQARALAGPVLAEQARQRGEARKFMLARDSITQSADDMRRVAYQHPRLSNNAAALSHVLQSIDQQEQARLDAARGGVALHPVELDKLVADEEARAQKDQELEFYRNQPGVDANAPLSAAKATYGSNLIETRDRLRAEGKPKSGKSAPEYPGLVRDYEEARHEFERALAVKDAASAKFLANPKPTPQDKSAFSSTYDVLNAAHRKMLDAKTKLDAVERTHGSAGGGGAVGSAASPQGQTKSSGQGGDAIDQFIDQLSPEELKSILGGGNQ